MDLDAFNELLTPRGIRALAEAEALRAAGPVAAATRLRRAYDAALTSAALTQAELRERAREKFGPDAGVMYFTPRGLEQSTRGQVARHRARRLTACEPHRPRVLDVCCGIGGDTIALARAGCQVDAVDADPLTVAVARANVEALGLGERVTVRTADAATVSPEGYDVLFADPARRTSRGRTFDPMAYSPPWPVVLDLVSRAPRACLKVAPGIPYAFIPADAEAEWVSYKGEVKEVSLWTGAHWPDAEDEQPGPGIALAGGPAGGPAEGPAGGPVEGPAGGPGDVTKPAPAGGSAAGPAEGSAEGPRVRRATLLPGGQSMTATGARALTGPVGRYLYEPDGAAIRAHLVGEVAELVAGRLPDPMIAYITGDVPIDTPWASRYEVQDVLAFSLKRLRSTLRERQIGNVTIKKRASAIDIERLRADLRLSGDKSAVIILTRIMDKPSVLICRPSPPA